VIPEATTPPAAARPRATRAGRYTLLYCAAALLLFAVLSYSAVSTKCATYDEPVYAAASYVALRYGDFRVEPEQPPLWKYWAAVPLVLFEPPLNANTDSRFFRGTPGQMLLEWPWSMLTIYRTPGNDPARILPPARFMMLLCGVALGAVLARFAYRAAGAVAGCVAVTLFCVDPNFLAHAALAKNDVPTALCTTALAYALWRAGDAMTLPRLAAVALLCGACVTTKLTGLLAAPITVLALGTRALLPVPWTVLGRTLATRGRRLLAAVAACVTCAVVTYACIWAVYRFRFDPAPDPVVHFDTSAILHMAAWDSFRARGVPHPTPADFAAWQPPVTVQAAVFALDHHLLPEPFIEGLLYIDAASLSRDAYLLGDNYRGGRWYYYPVAFFTKTPIATLLTLVLLAPLAALLVWRRRPSVALRGATEEGAPVAWLWTCLALPALVFGGVAVASGMNIGIRHILPVYPPLFVAAGVAIARAYPYRLRFLRPALILLAVGLAAETLAAYPDYIPFFNTAAGGARGGFRILADSNLDWGQDLPLLAEWQRRHPDRTLSFAYFGTSDPAYYGIRYRNLPLGYLLGPPPASRLPTTGVLAVSASILQGISSPDPNSNPYAAFRRIAPTEILGGSIYLFDLDAADR
jgi:hypothetical protein